MQIVASADVSSFSSVITKKFYSALTISEFILPNGMRVLLKPTTFKTNEVLIHGYARGGYSDASIFSWPNIAVGLAAQAYAGVGGKTAQDRVNTPDNYIFSERVELYHRVFHVQGATTDLPQLFAVVMDIFSRRNPLNVGWDFAQQALQAYDQAIEQSPVHAFQHELQKLLSGEHFLFDRLSAAEIITTSLPTAQKLLAPYFANPADFTLIIVGDVGDQLACQNMLMNTVGTVIKQGEGLDACDEIDLALEPARTGKVVTISGTGEHMATVTHVFQAHLAKNLRESMALFMAARALEARCFVIAKDHGVTLEQLSAMIQPAAYLSSTENRCFISYSVAPEQCTQAQEIVFGVVALCAQAGVSEEEIDAVRQGVSQQLVQLMQTNQYWMTMLERCDARGFDLQDLATWSTLANEITAQEVNEMCASHIVPTNNRLVVCLPE